MKLKIQNCSYINLFLLVQISRIVLKESILTYGFKLIIEKDDCKLKHKDSHKSITITKHTMKIQKVKAKYF